MALIAHAAQDDVLHWCGREAFFREAFDQLDDIERPLAEREREELEGATIKGAADAVRLIGGQHETRRGGSPVQVQTLPRLDDEMARHWPPVLARWRERNRAQIGALRALAAYDGDERLGGFDRQELERRLAAAIAIELDRSDKRLGTITSDDDVDEASRIVDGRYERAELLARVLERTGEEGRRGAAALRKLATASWQRYAAQLATCRTGRSAVPWDPYRDPAHIASLLGRALLFDRVVPEVQRLREKPPALANAVHERLLETLRSDLRLEERGGQRFLFDGGGRAIAALVRVEPLDVPALELDNVDTLLPQGARLLGSVKAHRLLRWEVITGHRQYLAGNRDARNLRVDGGWQALPEAVGLAATSNAVEELRRIVVAQAHLCWTWPDGTRGNMLSYTTRPAVGHRRGMLSLVLGDPLMPHFLFALPGRSPRGREDRRLVPVVDLPPFVGDRRTHGAQASFQLAVLGEMRRRAMELIENGGVRLADQDLAQLAANVGLASGLVARVIDRWMQDGSDGPAFLARVDGEADRFTLGDAYASALDLLREGGHREKKGAACGRRAAREKKTRWGTAGRSSSPLAAAVAPPLLRG